MFTYWYFNKVLSDIKKILSVIFLLFWGNLRSTKSIQAVNIKYLTYFLRKNVLMNFIIILITLYDFYHIFIKTTFTIYFESMSERFSCLFFFFCFIKCISHLRFNYLLFFNKIKKGYCTFKIKFNSLVFHVKNHIIDPFRKGKNI